MPPASALRWYQKWNFTVEVGGVSVGGFSKAGPVKQSLTMAEQYEGGSLVVIDITPIKLKTEKLTLERGASDNSELWDWWKALKTGTVDRRHVSIKARAGTGFEVKWNYPVCILTEFTAGEWDAKSDSENVIESMSLVPIDLERIKGQGSDL